MGRGGLAERTVRSFDVRVPPAGPCTSMHVSYPEIQVCEWHLGRLGAWLARYACGARAADVLLVEFTQSYSNPGLCSARVRVTCSGRRRRQQRGRVIGRCSATLRASALRHHAARDPIQGPRGQPLRAQALKTSPIKARMRRRTLAEAHRWARRDAPGGPPGWSARAQGSGSVPSERRC